MKVLFDASALGTTQDTPRDRTGVFRVAQSLSLALSRINGCELTFFTPIHNYAAVKRYFDSQEDWATRRFSGSLSGPFAHLAQGFQNKKYILDHSGVQHGGILRGTYRHAVNVAVDLIESIEIEVIDRISLSRHDIYHLLFYWGKPQKKPRRVGFFQTVFDLIPILHPEYFADNPDTRILTSALSDLGPEDYVVCISESTRNDLLNFNRNIDEQKCIVTPLAASNLFKPCASDDEIERVRKKYGIPSSAPYLLSVCTIEPRKNLPFLVQSFQDLITQQHHLKDLKLVLVGAEGWGTERFIADIRGSEALKGRIQVTGYVEDNDLSPLYSGALAFVYPSLYEGFGLPPLEAMQCGTPVVTSNTSSLPEVVGDAGIMVNPRDRDGLSQALLELCTDEVLRSKYSEKALERAGQFSWQRCAELTFSAYKQSLDDR